MRNFLMGFLLMFILAVSFLTLFQKHIIEFKGVEPVISDSQKFQTRTSEGAPGDGPAFNQKIETKGLLPPGGEAIKTKEIIVQPSPQPPPAPQQYVYLTMKEAQPPQNQPCQCTVKKEDLKAALEEVRKEEESK